MSLTTVRNIAIIALAALAITVLPHGGNFAAGVWALLSVAFLCAIAAVGFRFYKDRQLTLWSMTFQHRALLYGGIAVAFMTFSATSQLLLAGGVRTILWIGLMLGACLAIYTAINESRKYTI